MWISLHCLLTTDCNGLFHGFPDVGSLTVGALTVPWTQYGLSYAMPPVSLVSRILDKITSEGIELIITVLFWESRPWFPRLIEMLCDTPLLLPKSVELFLPWDDEKRHPLQGKLQLMVAKVSGQLPVARDFLKKVTNMWFTQSKRPHANVSKLSS